MAAIFTNLRNTVIAGIVLLVIIVVIVGLFVSWPSLGARDWWAFLFRWLHVVSGIMWVGLLWYLNFVQAPTMPKIPDEMKPAISRYITPAVLFWFRWAAMATLATGLLLAWLSPTAGGIGNALALGITNGGASTPIGIGMWMAIIMWANVWFVIWPKQKQILGIVEADAETRTRAARVALHVSRVNLAMSIPMLYLMVSQQSGGFA